MHTRRRERHEEKLILLKDRDPDTNIWGEELTAKREGEREREREREGGRGPKRADGPAQRSRSEREDKEERVERGTQPS